MLDQLTTYQKLLLLVKLKGGGGGGTIKTLTGNLPLTVSDALNHALASLTRYGLCEQRNLPKGYTQLDYIEGNGTAYIDTGVLLSNTDVFEITFQSLNALASPVMGAISGGTSYTSTNNLSVTYTINTGLSAYSVYCDGAAGNADYSWNGGNRADGLKHTIKYNGLNIAPMLDGVAMTQMTSHTLVENTPTVTTWLFGRNSTSTGTLAQSGVRIFDFNIQGKGHFIPARRNSDNVLGMYDTVSGSFFTNAGTGSFTAGPDATPSPSTPMDIWTNNGALCMVDDELPTGYKRLLGITFDGEVYYTTNYHLRGADTLRFSFNATRDARNIIGCYNSTSATNNLSFYFMGSSGTYLRYNGGLYRPVGYLNTVYNCVISPTGVTGLATGASWTEADFTSAAAMYIGWLDNATSPKFIGDMYGSIVVDGRANFIPVERQSDGAIGYWDGQAFLENQGTGTPVSLGYDGSHYQLSVVGTPEVLTVSGANLLDPSTSNITIRQIVNANGEIVTSANNWRTDYIPVEGGKTYAFWGRTKADNTISAYNRINWYTADKTAITPRPGYTINTVTVGTAPSNAAYAMLSCAPVNSSNPITRDTFDEYNWMFAEASAEVPYQPYVAPQTASVPMLLGVGDYKDAVELISGIKTGKVGIKVFDGTETFTVSASGAMITAISDVAIGAQNVPINTHFALETSPTSITVGTQRFGASAGKIYSANYYMKHPTITTVSAFKAWLATEYAAGTPVIVLYPLATETTEQTTPQHLVTHKGTNVVDSTANVEPVEAKIEYYGTEAPMLGMMMPAPSAPEEPAEEPQDEPQEPNTEDA